MMRPCWRWRVRAFPVNPTPALVERSRKEGWAVYYPASVAPVAVPKETEAFRLRCLSV